MKPPGTLISEDLSPSNITVQRRTLDDMTSEFVLSAGYKIYVSCGPCRLSREADARDICKAGKGAVPIRTLTFRCKACNAVGTPYVSGHVGGVRATWEGV